MKEETKARKLNTTSLKEAMPPCLMMQMKMTSGIRIQKDPVLEEMELIIKIILKVEAEADFEIIIL